MAKVTEARNPFYLLLLAVGVIFGITACAYVVMILQTSGPGLAPASPLLSFLERHGTLTLMVQLGLLAVLTAAAIGTDGMWDQRPTDASDANDRRDA